VAKKVKLSAIELPQTLARFRELGGDAHVAKPAIAGELQAAILLALEGRRPDAAAPQAPDAPVAGRGSWSRKTTT
jgi:hypothetical protein